MKIVAGEGKKSDNFGVQREGWTRSGSSEGFGVSCCFCVAPGCLLEEAVCKALVVGCSQWGWGDRLPSPAFSTTSTEARTSEEEGQALLLTTASTLRPLTASTTAHSSVMRSAFTADCDASWPCRRYAGSSKRQPLHSGPHGKFERCESRGDCAS